MIKIYLLFLPFLLLVPTSEIDVPESVVGTYVKELGSSDHHFVYTLEMKADGTFLFHYLEDFTKSKVINVGAEKRVKEKHGRGRWKLEGKVVSFMTETSSVSPEYQLDFGGSKARFDSKSPRDKSDRVIPTSLRFFESGIFWMVGITMEKQ